MECHLRHIPCLRDIGLPGYPHCSVGFSKHERTFSGGGGGRVCGGVYIQNPSFPR